MKKSILNIAILSLLFFSIFGSCKKEEITIDVSDVSISMNEYVAGGTLENNAIIGAVEAITNEGSIQFSMIEQTPEAAIKVNAISGLITVLNRNLFDFELNETLISRVKVENGDVSKEISITINLIDITSDNIYLTVIPEYTISMDENPQTDDLITGLYATSNGGQVSLTIIGQTPSNAFDLQDNELLVADASLFDFEMTTTLNVVVLASIDDLLEEINVQVNLNNISPEFSEPEIILENIDAWDLDFKENLLYFITSQSAVESLNIINPSEGAVPVTSANSLSHLSVFENDIYLASFPHFKKFSLLDNSTTNISDFPVYYYGYDEYVTATPSDMFSLGNFVYFDYNGCTSTHCFSNLRRFDVNDGLQNGIVSAGGSGYYGKVLVFENYLFMVDSYYSSTNVRKIDLNSIDLPDLDITDVTVPLSELLDELFIKDDFIYGVNDNLIYKFSLTNTPSDILQVFEFTDINFRSVKLVGDTLYFTDTDNHTLSKIEINFDE